VTAIGTWKASERAIAKAIGGRRIPVTGIDRDGADVETARFCIQAKLRKAIPTYLLRWLTGIVSTATPKGKIGILVLRRPRMRHDDALVVLSMTDFLRLVREPRPDGGHNV
jgi:hypothetical protein